MKKIVVLFVSLAIIIGLVFSVLSEKNRINKETHDIDNYGDWYGLLGHTNLLVFPENIETAIIKEYYYYNNSSTLGPSSCVYLKCEYNKNDWDTEINRIKNIDGIKYNTDLFEYDSYISICSEIENEYVLLADNNCMVYVYVLDGYKNKNLIDSKYLKIDKADIDNQYFTIYNNDNVDYFKYWPESWKF